MEVEIKPIAFDPKVLERVEPELSLQRHLSLGLRPSLKKFDEFRDIISESGTSSRYGLNLAGNKNDNIVIGSNVLKSGSAFVITNITAGIVEDMGNDDETIEKYDTIYPVVEVERGRGNAPPSDEEMITGQMLHDSLFHSRLIKKSALKIQCGIKVNDSETDQGKILYPDEVEDHELDFVGTKSLKKNWRFVIYAKITVFSRSGPIFDLCWNSLIYALKDVKLPRIFADDTRPNLRVTIRTRNRKITVQENSELFCDDDRNYPLPLEEENIGYASNYGLIKLVPEESILNNNDTEDVDMEGNTDSEESVVLLADIDKEAEEVAISSRLNIISTPDGSIKYVKYLSWDNNKGGINIELLKNAIELSIKRSKDLK